MRQIMTGKKFIRKIEDFTCEFCGKKVKGSGYTDHCPYCLFSKHVDLFPGDRKAKCKGLMEPLGVMKQKGKWRIYYRCLKCGRKRFNKVDSKDNWKMITALSANPLKLHGLN